MRSGRKWFRRQLRKYSQLACPKNRVSARNMANTMFEHIGHCYDYQQRFFLLQLKQLKQESAAMPENGGGE